MDQQRWKQIDDLLQSALDRPAGERPAFLKSASGGDLELEREVLSLLAVESQAEAFLETPAMAVAAKASAAAEDSAAFEPGTMISHFRIVGKLGGGGMGVVYKAEDTRLERFVALKFVLDHRLLDDEIRNRFHREARAASALNHPRICSVHDIGEHQGRPFIVMEYLQGSTLKERLASGPIARETLLTIGIDIADALEAAHRAGIIHRDVKPANIWITPTGQAKLLDFGLARFNQPAGSEPETRMTGTGMVMGTLAYMSPEQLQGTPVDSRTDIYSLGVVLWEMATGSLPSAPGRPAGKIAPDLGKVLTKCLDPERERRYPSAAALRSDLERLRNPSRISSKPLAAMLAVAILSAAAIAAYVYWKRAPIPADRDTIVLAEFSNKAGDPVFGRTLEQALAVELQQSPSLTLLPDERLRQTLGFMVKPANTPVTPEIASEICQRTGGAAFVHGSIANVGAQYVLGLQAKACGAGQILNEEQVRVARKEDVLNALTEAARKLRAKIVDPAAAIDRRQLPLEQVTTPSLEALKTYTSAFQVRRANGDPHAGIILLKRAIELDPDFAMAFALLSNMYFALGEADLSRSSAIKAFLLRERASQHERFFVDSLYYQQATGNLEKAQQTAEAWAEAYPRDQFPYDSLAWIYQLMGQYEKSLKASERIMELDPDFPPGLINIAWSHLFLERRSEAEKVLLSAAARNVKAHDLLLLPYYIAFLNGDKTGMDRAATAGKEKAVAADWITHAEASVLAYAGSVKQSRAVELHAVDLARQAGTPDRAASYEAASAVREAFYGNTTEARSHAHAALALSSSRDIRFAAALTFLLSGDSAQAKTLTDEMEKRFPEDTNARITYVPLLRAVASLSRRDAAGAIQQLETCKPYELGITQLWPAFIGNLYPIYFRGQAYLAAGRATEAAAEFQRVLDHPGIVFTDPVGVVARLGLARAHAAGSGQAVAMRAYQDFFKFWAGADSDIPLLRQAQAEYLNLSKRQK